MGQGAAALPSLQGAPLAGGHEAAWPHLGTDPCASQAPSPTRRGPHLVCLPQHVDQLRYSVDLLVVLLLSQLKGALPRCCPY
jgi:hypothetical protein